MKHLRPLFFCLLAFALHIPAHAVALGGKLPLDHPGLSRSSGGVEIVAATWAEVYNLPEDTVPSAVILTLRLRNSGEADVPLEAGKFLLIYVSGETAPPASIALAGAGAGATGGHVLPAGGEQRYIIHSALMQKVRDVGFRPE